MNEKPKDEIGESEIVRRARMKARRRKRLLDLENEIREFAARSLALIDEIVELDKEIKP